MPAEEGFSEVDSKINVVSREIDGSLEQFVVREQPYKSSSACIDRKQIKIVANVMRMFGDQMPQFFEICFFTG
jgi:hypothetical protein